MMSIDEAIREFEEQRQSASTALDQIGQQMDDETRRIYVRRFEMAEWALSALYEKGMRENPNPLRPHALLQMNGQPVYVVPLDRVMNPRWNISGWCVLDCADDTPHKGALIPGVDEASRWPLWGYGKTWTAYRSKPREAADR